MRLIRAGTWSFYSSISTLVNFAFKYNDWLVNLEFIILTNFWNPSPSSTWFGVPYHFDRSSIFYSTENIIPAYAITWCILTRSWHITCWMIVRWESLLAGWEVGGARVTDGGNGRLAIFCYLNYLLVCAWSWYIASLCDDFWICYRNILS